MTSGNGVTVLLHTLSPHVKPHPSPNTPAANSSPSSTDIRAFYFAPIEGPATVLGYGSAGHVAGTGLTARDSPRHVYHRSASITTITMYLSCSPMALWFLSLVSLLLLRSIAAPAPLIHPSLVNHVSRLCQRMLATLRSLSR